MRYCSNCGHELGVGRYCTNCGEPVTADSPTDTAERPALPADSPPPPPPPPAGAVPPPPPRYPLYADEVDGPVTPVPGLDEPTAYPVSPAGSRAQHRRRSWWPWALGAAVLVLVAAVGVALLTGGDDERDGSTAPSKHDSGGSTKHHGDPSDSASTDLPAGDLTADSTITVPKNAPPGQDADGKPTTYVGANMLDGDPATCWRIAGDGTGTEITVTLPSETRLSSVGLVNGYAKTVDKPGGGTIDWYHGNRRIEAVDWEFDDGTTVHQDLGDTTDLQSIDVDVTTTTVTLRLATVSAPGKGPASRNYTAISDLSVVAAD
jgi:hypothetical protein